MTLNEKIGLQLRMRRMEKKMTIEEVADRLGVAKNTVSYMELGKKKITVEMVMRFFLCFPEKRKEKRKDFSKRKRKHKKIASGMGGRGHTKKEDHEIPGSVNLEMNVSPYSFRNIS